ncbi:MAG: hypothetical protein FWG10_11475 [Eubacteriaceae bacterium]|nr:hypothetical protein [Eubacteriaceae bacterium]
MAWFGIQEKTVLKEKLDGMLVALARGNHHNGAQRVDIAFAHDRREAYQQCSR